MKSDCGQNDHAKGNCRTIPRPGPRPASSQKQHRWPDQLGSIFDHFLNMRPESFVRHPLRIGAKNFASRDIQRPMLAGLA
jgi:hypothetical protein